jgi:hypothetical protein
VAKISWRRWSRLPAPPSFTRTKHEVPWWMKNLTLDECGFFVWQTGSRTFCFHPAAPSITTHQTRLWNTKSLDGWKNSTGMNVVSLFFILVGLLLPLFILVTEN